jgi:hypothetical protein
VIRLPWRVAPRAVLLCWLVFPVPAQAWTRAYVIEWFEPAHYFDVDEGVTSAEVPGRDCPQGANPTPDWRKILVTSYRTQAEVDRFLDPAFRNDPGRSLMTYAVRGPHQENVYSHPEAMPDPHVREVQGKIAYGFDLDGNENTGFTSPDGQRGIDNAYYQASGCFVHWRGRQRDAAGFKYGNDGMRDGRFTIVVVLSGAQDPRNDDDAKLGIYTARDPIVKDANGNVAADYSFRIDPAPELQTVLPVKIRDGIAQTTEPATIHMHDWNAREQKQLNLTSTRLRLELREDGSLFGLMGGYRDVTEHWRSWSREGTARAALVEVVGRIDLPGWWHALQRNADAVPDPGTGRNTAISTAYHLWGIPAFVIAPEGGAAVETAIRFDPPQDAASVAPEHRP